MQSRSAFEFDDWEVLAAFEVFHDKSKSRDLIRASGDPGHDRGMRDVVDQIEGD